MPHSAVSRLQTLNRNPCLIPRQRLRTLPDMREHIVANLMLSVPDSLLVRFGLLYIPWWMEMILIV